MKPNLTLAATVGALAVALTLVLTACGGGSGESDDVASLTETTGQGTSDGAQGSGDGDSTAPSEEDREEAMLEFAQCMREHGVDFPDPVNGRLEFKSERGDEEKVQEAQEACRGILEDAAPPPLNEGQQAELREATLEFARCMREHGIDYPDPEFHEDGGVLQQMPEGAKDDPQFEEAQEACQPILDEAEPDPDEAPDTQGS